MKQLLVLSIALLLSACAHETTTLDRELALKLADRPQVIVAPAAAAPIINVNVGTNGAVSAAPAQHVDVPLVDNRLCSTYPVYDITTGRVTGSRKACDGGGE